MSDGAQPHVLLPPRGRSCPAGRSKVSLDHAVDRLDLPALSVEFLVRPALESPPHEAAIMSRGAVGPGAAAGRRDQRANPQFSAGQTMVVLRVIARVGQHRFQMQAFSGRQQQPWKMGVIGAQSGGRLGRENQMRGGLHRQGELGQTLVDRTAAAVGVVVLLLAGLGLFPCLAGGLPSPLLKMPADMVGLEQGRIQCRRPLFTPGTAGAPASGWAFFYWRAAASGRSARRDPASSPPPRASPIAGAPGTTCCDRAPS